MYGYLESNSKSSFDGGFTYSTTFALGSSMTDSSYATFRGSQLYEHVDYINISNIMRLIFDSY